MECKTGLKICNLQVIASRGDNIIAVANPALMDCSHAIKEEPTDEKSSL